MIDRNTFSWDVTLADPQGEKAPYAYRLTSKWDPAKDFVNDGLIGATAAAQATIEQQRKWVPVSVAAIA